MADKKPSVDINVTAFPSMLATLFIGLKLTDNIDWSWLWVLSPLWLPLAIILPIVVIAAIIAAQMNK